MKRDLDILYLALGMFYQLRRSGVKYNRSLRTAASKYGIPIEELGEREVEVRNRRKERKRMRFLARLAK